MPRTKRFISKEQLYKLYWIEKLSLYQIAKMYKIGSSTVYNKMKSYDIPTRSAKEGAKLNPPKIDYKKGKEHHFYGRKHTKKTKEKISQTKRKLQINKQELYDLYWNKKLSQSQIAKILNSKQATIHACMKKFNIPTRHFSEGAKLNPPKLPSGKDCHFYGKKGPKNYGWKGGVSHINNIIRHMTEYIDWRTKVFERDNYSCIWCGAKGKLNADHIKPLAIMIKEHELKSSKDALKCEELWDIGNGRTLCVDCHKQTETYGLKLLKELYQKGEKL